MYQGVKPPLNNVVKKKKKEKKLRQVKSLRESTYPVSVDISNDRQVPVRVTKMVLKYARWIRPGFVNTKW